MLDFLESSSGELTGASLDVECMVETAAAERTAVKSTAKPHGVVLPWEFERDGETVKILPQGRLISLNLRLNIRAAIDGLGFHATFEGNIRDHIKAGRLVSVLDDWCQEFSGPYLYYPSRRQPPPALRAFVDFVREWRKSPMR